MTAEIGHDLQRAAAILRSGGLVAFPTETVYGLGASALDANAVARIFEAKRRPSFDPLIVHVASRDDLPRVVQNVSPTIESVLDSFWPGPLSVVLPRSREIPDLVTSGLDTVAVRMPEPELSRGLIAAAALPIAAPSANLFGRISPTTAEHVFEQLGDRIDYILDGGPCRIGVESTVIQHDSGAANASWRLLRPGGLTIEHLETVVGRIQYVSESEHPVARAQPSPGMLPRHYAPQTKLEIIAPGCSWPSAPGRTGVLLIQPREVDTDCIIEVLSDDGDLNQCATAFFAALRRLDALGLDRLLAEEFPEEGLGRALNDRLRRAAR